MSCVDCHIVIVIVIVKKKKKKTRNDVEVGGMVLFFSKTEVSLILVGTIVSTVSELIVFYASTFFIIFFLVPQFTFAIL